MNAHERLAAQRSRCEQALLLAVMRRDEWSRAALHDVADALREEIIAMDAAAAHAAGRAADASLAAIGAAAEHGNAPLLPGASPPVERGLAI